MYHYNNVNDQNVNCFDFKKSVLTMRFKVINVSDVHVVFFIDVPHQLFLLLSRWCSDRLHSAAILVCSSHQGSPNLVSISQCLMDK